MNFPVLIKKNGTFWHMAYGQKTFDKWMDFASKHYPDSKIEWVSA